MRRTAGSQQRTLPDCTLRTATSSPAPPPSPHLPSSLHFAAPPPVTVVWVYVAPARPKSLIPGTWHVLGAPRNHLGRTLTMGQSVHGIKYRKRSRAVRMGKGRCTGHAGAYGHGERVSREESEPEARGLIGRARAPLPTSPFYPPRQYDPKC